MFGTARGRVQVDFAVRGRADTAKAIDYALNQWAALTLYVDDGAVEIDHNTAERALRAAANDRRNYLFAGADFGGERAAAIYNLVGAAKLNFIEPDACLRYVVTRIIDRDQPYRRTCTVGRYRSAPHHSLRNTISRQDVSGATLKMKRRS